MKKILRRLLGVESGPAVVETQPLRHSMMIQDLLASLPPEKDKYRHELRLPKLPFKVPDRDMAFDSGGASFPFAGYLNQTVAGAAAWGLYFPGYPYLAELAQRSEFRQPVETTAKELTRRWIEFKTVGGGDKREKVKQIEARFIELNVQHVIMTALVYDGFYGVGHLFAAIRDQEDLTQPLTLDPKTLGKGCLLGIKAIEPMWVTPLSWNATNATEPNFYSPDSWQAIGQRIHSSRLHQVLSRPVPDIIKPAYNFGGISLSQLIEPYVDRWLRTVAGVNKLINNFSILNLQTDMNAVLQGKSNGDLLRRMRMFIRDRDNQGLFVSDKESELLQQLAVPLSGLSELQAQAQEHMSAPTHLPLVVATGITPSGLNASSDSELEVWHDFAHSMQETVVRPPLSWIFQLVQYDLFGEVDPSITFDFVPLKEVTGEAASRIYKTKADAGVAYIESGVIDPQEERERLASDPDSGYINLDPDKMIALPGGEGQEGEETEEL